MAHSVKFGTLPKETNPLVLGTWAFGGEHWGGQNEADTRDVMEVAWDKGINHWDTALLYGDGSVERLIGAFLKDKWDDAFIASKGIIRKGPQQIVHFLYQSLRNLKAEKIDLYYVHWPKSGVDLRPYFELLENERKKGTIGAIGVSNFSVEQMKQAMEVAKIDAHQLCYNLFWRKPEAEIIPYCMKNKIEVVSYSSLAQGVLTGKFPEKPTFKEGDHRPSTVFFDPAVWPHLYNSSEKLKDLGREYGCTPVAIALQWLNRQPGLSSMTVGARNKEQSRQLFSSLNDPVPSEILDRATILSDDAVSFLPNEQNIFRFYP
tara:strand:- start:96 stop:1049 length:954 start_codon:yes stop_codon:yes gene_type:complete